MLAVYILFYFYFLKNLQLSAYLHSTNYYMNEAWHCAYLSGAVFASSKHLDGKILSLSNPKFTLLLKRKVKVERKLKAYIKTTILMSAF